MSLGLALGLVAILFLRPHAGPRLEGSPESPVAALSVVGCSGHPFLLKVIEELAPGRLVGSVVDASGKDLRVSGHVRPTADNAARYEAGNIKAVLIYADPRYTLKNLVFRSLYDYAPQKFTKPNIHHHAHRFHWLVKDFAPNRNGEGFVEFYVDVMGSRELLADIFQVTEWRHYPWVHSVKYEELTNLQGGARDKQLEVIRGIADFLGVSPSESQVETIADLLDDHMDNKRRDRGEKDRAWEEVFTPGDRELFKEYFGPLVVSLEYESNANW